MMCYLIAKKFSETGCLALQMTHGQHLADFKERLVQAVGYEDIQLVTISRRLRMVNMNHIILWIQSRNLTHMLMISSGKV